MSDAELIRQAIAVTRPRQIGHSVEVASVGAAIETADGQVFTGVCIDAACSIGFCAEHAAVAAMITSGKSHVLAMVAVDATGTVLAPCGRCRELVLQIDSANRDTRVLLPGGRVTALSRLMPEWWQATEISP